MNYQSKAGDADREELAFLLSGSREEVAARSRHRFDAVTESGRPLVLFGAGSIGRRTLAGLTSLGIEVAAFADNNPRMWDTVLDGVPVWSPERAASTFATRANFVVTIWQGGDSVHRISHTVNQLSALGCDRIALVAELYWKYPGTFLPYLILDSPERVFDERQQIFDSFDLVADQRSRRTWIDHLRFRLELDYERLHRDPGEEYFAEDLVRLQDHEVFVDCGAYTGDTIASFLRHNPRFDRIVAFEPDPSNYAELGKYVATLENRDRIAVHPRAVASRCEVLRFSDRSDMTSKIATEGTEVMATSLDAALSEVCPTFVKLDVEGAEGAVLEGARDTLRRSRPVLAIALEHNSHDLWRLPLKVASLVDNYAFHFRHHSEQGFDLVCYAIPGERVPKANLF
jgi:FkbM family methyltransferase